MSGYAKVQIDFVQRLRNRNVHWSPFDDPLPLATPVDGVMRISLAERDAICDELEKLRAAQQALQELVDCKYLKDHMVEACPGPEGHSWDQCPSNLMEQEYARRKPLAWEQAQRALAALKD